MYNFICRTFLLLRLVPGSLPDLALLFHKHRMGIWITCNHSTTLWVLKLMNYDRLLEWHTTFLIQLWYLDEYPMHGSMQEYDVEDSILPLQPSLNYTAPELVRSKTSSAGVSSDIFSFGCLTYHLVARKPLFDCHNNVKMVLLKPKLISICFRCLYILSCRKWYNICSCRH